jgi:putative transposase
VLNPAVSNIKNQLFLGSEAFVNEMQSKMEQEKKVTYIPQSHYKPVKESLTKYSNASPHRNEGIKIAYATA